jgi:hypothetical protein
LGYETTNWQNKFHGIESFKSKSLTDSPQRLGFEENKGQVIGQNSEWNKAVKYFLKLDGLLIFLTEKGISYQFTRLNFPSEFKELIDLKPNFKNSFLINELEKKVNIETFRMDMMLIGSNLEPRISVDGKSDDFINYYNYNALEVHTYNKVTFHNVYPGIDWVITINKGKVKYDFIVKPGANAKSIKMEFKYHEGLALNQDGGITLSCRMGSIIENRPQSFQKKKEVKTKFILDGNKLSFLLNEYNLSDTLIIDPALAWSTYYGGATVDYGFSTSTDATGNVYFAGHASSFSGIASGGHQNINGGGSYDAFLVKFNSAGARQWATYYGGSGTDFGNSISTDGIGNIYLTGSTTSTVNIASGGHQNSYSGGPIYGDGFLVKFNSAGLRLWATYYGGFGTDIGLFCTTDINGNIFMTGATDSPVAIATNGVHQSSFSGSIDAFIVKFNTSGTRLWSTYYGGTNYDYGYGCSFDSFGNIYFTGMTASTSNMAASGHQNIYGGGIFDAFLAKFNSFGILQWGTYYGGPAEERAYSCHVDGSNDVYIAGYTESSTNIASGGHQNLYGGNPDAFLVKFNSSGLRLWGTYFGGSANDYGFSCIGDQFGNIFLAGRTQSSNGISLNGYQNTLGGIYDAFLSKFNSSGVLQWGTYFGGLGDDWGTAIAYHPSGNFYLGGYTTSTANIANSGHQNSSGGSEDAFLAKLCDNLTQPSIISGTSSTCPGSTLNFSVINDPAAISYSWAYSGTWSGTSNTNSITVMPISSGIVSVVSQNTCGASLARTLNLQVLPSPTISVNSGSICEGQSFTITPSGASSYTFSGGGAIISPTINSSYSVSGTSSSGCTSTQVAISNVTVNAVPTITVNSGVICSGQNFTITPGGAFTYTFSGGSSIVSPISNTSYSIWGISTEGCTSNSFAISNVTVNPLPNVAVNSGSICLGESFTIQPAGAFNYSISGGIWVVNPVVTSIFTVSGMSTLGCQGSAISTVVVNSLPVLGIFGIPTIICAGEEVTLSVTGANTYSWSNGFTGSSLIINPILTTTYSLTGINIEGCSASTVAIINVDPCLGINNQNLSSSFLVLYPNPNNGVFVIEVNEASNIKIYNSLGQQLIELKLVKGQNNVDLNYLTNGIYVISFQNLDSTLKWVKD